MLIDVHCHANLYLVLEEIIKDAKNVGVQKIISVGMSFISLERILEISNNFDTIYPALGIHPEEVTMNQNIENQIDSVINLIKQNKENICAIGDILLKRKSFIPFKRKFLKICFH